MNIHSFSSNKALKIIRNASFFAVFLLIFSGNYSAVNAQENTARDTPRVIAQAQTNIRELPRTGLPMIGFGLASLLPGGWLIRKLSRRNSKTDEAASSVWVEKQLKS